MRNPAVAADMTSHIVELVDLDISYVRSEAIINLAGMARVFPAVKSLIVPCLSRCLRRTENGEAKAAVVWMIGEFGEEIVEAPYMIEPYIDSYDEDTTPTMKLQLLVAAMKLFFKRPPEMHLMLGRLLKFAVNDTANQDVHDRAMLYHRVLSADVSTAETMFSGARDAASATGADGAPLLFFEVSNTEIRDKVFEEFNSLAVIYGYPSAQFIDPIFEKV
jgi:AP-4 complex subunit beta-1